MSENSEQNLLANVRLCDAIKWHPCLYDSKSKVYQMKHAVDAAWQSIANECEDTVANCKLRWRIIRKSYLRSFRKNVPYNRYYLNDYLDFLKPHLPTLESNEDRASKAEDYDIIQLDEEQQEDDDDDDEEEDDDDDDDDENDGEQDEDNDQDDEDEGNDEEVEEYELRNDNIEDPDEDSDTASAEETLKAIRRGRPKGKASNMSTPDIEEDNDNLSSQDKNVESGRIGRRLMRTRKANSRYSEYDIYVKRYKKEAKQEEKPKTNNKRSLEPNIVEKSENKQDEKRPRRSLDRSKNLPTLTREEFNKPKQPLPKKLEVKLMKPKVIEPPPAETKAPKPTPKEVFKVRTSCVKIDKNLAEMARIAKPKMVDNSTNSVATKTVDAGTQYDANEPNTVDDDFVESLKPQMALMNSRQKFSFKKRVFQSLMDVFDDSTNFPNKNELIELPNTGAPRFESTTTGELRLMRELVNLVTAAKSTPEIMNAREKVATPKNDTLDLTPSPIKAPFAQSEAPTSQTSSSSTSNAQGKRSETLGLPRHILQKVVKVAGSNGGTILAHEGDKRRVYRIYPKGTLPPSVANNTAVPASTSIGTFYVTPPKPQIANNSQTNTMVRTTTQVGNTVHGKPITFTTISKGGTQQTSNNLTASTPTSMMAQVTKKMALFNASTPAAMSRQRLAGRTQISQRRYSITNATSKNSPVQNKVVTSTNPPATSATQEKPSSSNAYPVQRFSVSSLEATSKSGLSQIQISQPISLNVAATPRESGIKAFLSSAEEGNSGDNEIFPDNPLPEAVAENVASNDDLLMVDANIKDEPMD